jgi:PAS domain S-box-containing protein
MTLMAPWRRNRGGSLTAELPMLRPRDDSCRVWPSDPIVELFDISLDMLGCISFAGYFTLLNPTLGWTRAQLMAKPFLFFVHPDDYERTARASAAIAEPGASPVVEFENRCRTRDGDYRWISWTVVPKRCYVLRRQGHHGSQTGRYSSR